MADTKNRRDNTETKRKSQQLNEIEDILKKADSESPLRFDFVEYKTTIDIHELNDIQDPDLSYTLYHKILGNFKRKYIPKGITGKPIRDQINLLLKEGNIKPRDGKQARHKIMEEAINIFTDWLNKYKGQNLFGLYIKYRDLNVKNNYKVD